MQFIVDSLKPKNFPVLVVVVGILYEFVSIDSQVKATAGDLRSLKTDNNASFDKIAAATKASFDKNEAATKASFDKMEAKLDIVAKANQESLEKAAKENRESLEKAAKENRILREASAKESRDLFLNMVMHLSNSGSQHRPNGGDNPPTSTPLPPSTPLHTPI
jgi:leucyl aminopeptidase (aminopeptidase T)